MVSWKVCILQVTLKDFKNSVYVLYNIKILDYSGFGQLHGKQLLNTSESKKFNLKFQHCQIQDLALMFLVFILSISDITFSCYSVFRSLIIYKNVLVHISVDTLLEWDFQEDLLENKLYSTQNINMSFSMILNFVCCILPL